MNRNLFSDHDGGPERDPKPNAEEDACFTSVHDVKLSRTKPGNVDVPNNNSSSHKPAAQSSTPATNTKPVVDKPSPICLKNKRINNKRIIMENKYRIRPDYHELGVKFKIQ